MTGSGQRSVSTPVILLPVTGEHQEAFSLHGLPCTADAMFTGLIFTSFVLQLAEATRPAERSRSDNECGDLEANGCKTCDPNGGNKICLTCKNDAYFLAPNKKSCKAACDAEKEIQDPAAGSTKACKCDGSKGYTLQSDGTCAKAAPGNECGDLEANGCKTCDPNGGNKICLTCKNDAYFLAPNKKSCKAACDAEKEIQDPAAGSTKACKCDGSKGYTLQSDGTCGKSPAQCNTPNCKACDNPKTDNEICTECNDNNYLTPTNQCIPDCTTISGYYGGTDKKCKACNSECAECVGAASTQCSACRAGKMLQYAKPDTPAEGGTCVDQCATSSQATGCKTCGAKIGGTDYCSQCKGEQVPINGVCADNSAASRANICTSDNNGGCTGCANGYFLFASGCYKIGQQPGKQVCTQANGGKCQTCTNGLAADNGDCSKSACHSTCATCTEANQPNKCSTCPPGRYLDASKACKLCTETSNNIQGVANCASCAPPSNNQGSVLCYLMNGDSAGGSTNKSGLSTGAIAGISVAVIVVVGGLVGFLCWWFLCRGKA
ncbi:Variant-specific surface protein [Giardia duodenalis]|uniref:Variant-specific surface protein n=1 Tax=Giardia intestinalis TaxID=5741 RepID=V6TJG6_GIAIN|nr:Variant-specific surface protein [Giardia intestinalis]